MTAAPSTPDTSLAIVGPGRVGRAIHAAARAGGIDASLHGRAGLDVAGAGIVLICTRDEQIAEAAEAISESIAPEAVVGHVSGATPLSALAPAADRCAGAFGLHPLQTIPSGETPLAAVPCAVSADRQSAHGRALALAEHLGMRPFAIEEELRGAYHAAATMASNFLFALEESAASLLGSAGVAEPRKALGPLVTSSAANWAAHGPAALTGPIARGDEATISRQRQAVLERAPELIELYDVLAEQTRKIAGPSGAIA